MCRACTLQVGLALLSVCTSARAVEVGKLQPDGRFSYVATCRGEALPSAAAPGTPHMLLHTILIGRMRQAETLQLKLLSIHPGALVRS